MILIRSTDTRCVYQSEIDEENKQVPAPHFVRAVQTRLTVSRQEAGEEIWDTMHKYATKAKLSLY